MHTCRKRQWERGDWKWVNNGPRRDAIFFRFFFTRGKITGTMTRARLYASSPFFFSFTFSGEIPLIFNDTPDGHPLRVNEPGKRHRNFPEKSTYLDNARFILLANANWDWAFKNHENRWNFTLFVIKFSFFPLFSFWWAVILLEERITDSAFLKMCVLGH